MIGATFSLAVLVATPALDTWAQDFGPRFMQPGIQRFVASDGSTTLEVRLPDTAGYARESLEPTYRLVRRATSRARVPSAGFEPDYAPIDEGDVALSVGPLVAAPITAAVFPGDGGFAVLTNRGLDVVGADGVLRTFVPMDTLSRVSETQIELRQPDALVLHDNLALASLSSGRVLLAVDGALLLALWRSAPPPNDRPSWSFWRIDPSTGDVEACDPGDLLRDPAQLRACPGADVLVELAARASRLDLLREVCEGAEYAPAARLRAAWHLGAEGRESLEALVVTALDGALAGTAEPHVVVLAVAVARTLRSAAILPRALGLRERDRGVESWVRIALEEILVRAGAAAFDLVAAEYGALAPNDPRRATLLTILVSIAEADDPALEASIARFLEGLAGGDSSSRASAFDALWQASRHAPRLAGAVSASELRAHLASGARMEPLPVAVLQHRDVVAVLIEALDQDLTPEQRRGCLELLSRIPDLASVAQQRGSSLPESSEALRAWWAKAKARPQEAELMAHVFARRDTSLVRGLEACLAAGDEVHRLVAARVLAALGERVEAAGLMSLAQRVLDGWRPRDLAEQTARQTLREFVEGRAGAR